MTIKDVNRILAIFLILSMTLPLNPAWALRNEQAVNASMEKKIGQALDQPAAGAEEETLREDDLIPLNWTVLK